MRHWGRNDRHGQCKGKKSWDEGSKLQARPKVLSHLSRPSGPSRGISYWTKTTFTWLSMSGQELWPTLRPLLDWVHLDRRCGRERHICLRRLWGLSKGAKGEAYGEWLFPVSHIHLRLNSYSVSATSSRATGCWKSPTHDRAQRWACHEIQPLPWLLSPTLCPGCLEQGKRFFQIFSQSLGHFLSLSDISFRTGIPGLPLLGVLPGLPCFFLRELCPSWIRAKYMIINKPIAYCTVGVRPHLRGLVPGSLVDTKTHWCSHPLCAMTG